MSGRKGCWLFFVLSLTSGIACAMPLDLQYRPDEDNAAAPDNGQQVQQHGPQTPPAPAQGKSDGTGYGWQWFAPRITTSRPAAWRDSREAVRIAQEKIDQQRLQEHKEPLFNDLPPVLQSMPLTIDMGIKYHF